MGITEIAFLPLQEHKIPEANASDTGKAHSHAIETLLAQPGAQRVYWGRQVEDSQMLMWFVDWDDIDDHKRFMTSNEYKPFLDVLSNIIGDGAKAYHARFDPHPPQSALSDKISPTTEIVTMWFPTSISPLDQENILESVKRFISVLEKEAKTYKASAGGWVDEEIDISGTNEKGKAYVLLVGWDSVEAHMEFRQTQAFKDSIDLILGAKDLKKIEAVHSTLKEVVRTEGSH